MTNLKDYLRDLVTEVRDEQTSRILDEKESLSVEELESMVDTYIKAITVRLIGGEK